MSSLSTIAVCDGSGFGKRVSGLFPKFFLCDRNKEINSVTSSEQRLRLKKDSRRCPRIKYKGRTSQSVYEGTPRICGGETGEGKSTYFCWPCLVMGDISTVI